MLEQWTVRWPLGSWVGEFGQDGACSLFLREGSFVPPASRKSPMVHRTEVLRGDDFGVLLSAFWNVADRSRFFVVRSLGKEVRVSEYDMVGEQWSEHANSLRDPWLAHSDWIHGGRLLDGTLFYVVDDLSGEFVTHWTLVLLDHDADGRIDDQDVYSTLADWEASAYGTRALVDHRYNHLD